MSQQRHSAHGNLARSEAADFFVIRRPLRAALSTLLGPLAAPLVSDDYRSAIRSDPVFLAAIFLSSRSLFDATMRWIDSPQVHDIPTALTRCISRARSRSTPFGLFSLLSCGRLADHSRFPLPMRPDDVRVVHHPSYETEAAVSRRSLQGSPIRQFIPNPTLWRVGSEYRAWAHVGGDDANGCVVASVEADDELDDVFSGSGTPLQADANTVEEWLDLVAAGLLVEEASCPRLLVAPAPLESASDGRDLPARHGEIAAWMSELDALAVDDPLRPSRYAAIEGRIRQLLGDDAPLRPAIVATAFATSRRPEDVPTLSQQVADEAARVSSELLQCFSEPNGALMHLGRAFAEQWSFESRPLLEVLHGELGRLFERLASEGTSPTAPFELYDRHLLNAVLAAAAEGKRELELTWRELRDLVQVPAVQHRDRLVSATFSVLESRNGPRLAWHGLEVATGTALLSRFEIDDAALARNVSDWLHANRELQEGDAVLAEIVYLPHPTVGNVIRRTIKTSHAIYLTPCDRDAGPQAIELSTLRLRWRHDHLELWCTALGKQVIPVLNNAHYHAGSPHLVYRFLGAIATQELTKAQLRIPTSLLDLSHCPRIVVDGSIFRGESWTLALAEGNDARTDCKALREHLQSIGVPRRFSWSLLDRAVMVDADNDADLISLQAALRGIERLVLTESFADYVGGVAHEIVLPIRLRIHASARRSRRPVLPLCTEERKFLPGSEYIYVQLFADAQRLDRLPPDVFSRLGAPARHRPFFLKYAVPAPHLRLRMYSDDGSERSALLARIMSVCDELTREGKIDHAALATYEPEVERYGGGELWRHSEICFSTDSEFACRMSVCIDEDSLGEDAVVFTMAMSWLHLAKDFGVSLEQASALLRAPRSLGNKPPYWQLESGAILRRTQSWVADVASSTWDDGFVRTLTQAAAQRSRDSRQAIARLAECLRMDEGWREWLLRAHAHLSINRMTRWDMVDSEVIALSLAARIADSLLARGLKRLPGLNEVAEAI